MTMQADEPAEMVDARKLLKEFEDSPGISKKNSFEEAMVILTGISEHSNSKFSERAKNLKRTYIKALIRKLGSTDFPSLDDWILAIDWVVEGKKFSEIEEILSSDPELERDWKKFLEPWAAEFSELVKRLKLSETKQ